MRIYVNAEDVAGNEQYDRWVALLEVYGVEVWKYLGGDGPSGGGLTLERRKTGGLWGLSFASNGLLRGRTAAVLAADILNGMEKLAEWSARQEQSTAHQRGDQVEVLLKGSTDYLPGVYLGPASEATDRPARRMVAIDDGGAWRQIPESWCVAIRPAKK
jgi:hypothetical protein